MKTSTSIPVNDYFTRRMRDYALADEKLRKECKDHWLGCYAEELSKGRYDEVAARNLANFALIDAGLAEIED